MEDNKDVTEKQIKALTELLWDYLKRDPDNKDRRRTGWGTKTKLGLARSVQAALALGCWTKANKTP